MHRRTIRVIDQDAINKYKYRCYVQHEGGNVEASEEQGDEGLANVQEAQRKLAQQILCVEPVDGQSRTLYLLSLVTLRKLISAIKSTPSPTAALGHSDHVMVHLVHSSAQTISALNSIQPLLWRDKLRAMQVNTPLVSWITDELSGRPQFVRLRKCMLDHRSSWDLSLSLSWLSGPHSRCLDLDLGPPGDSASPLVSMVERRSCDSGPVLSPDGLVPVCRPEVTGGGAVVEGVRETVKGGTGVCRNCLGGEGELGVICETMKLEAMLMEDLSKREEEGDQAQRSGGHQWVIWAVEDLELMEMN
ncbi:hypothetical protein L3Q82_021147 [Scortum barcoo]|uniref:Uncharacterized protein n=1 Tax=Scortum barcoo TaxID=214431 RepID=A0ACB8X6L7_9TELE|nr:hypothetical protein L3Q82_021147 [Scortum barcoo]